MSNKVSLTIILVLLAIGLTHLFDVNPTAHNFIVKYFHKVGFSAGNFITGTSVCPPGWKCEEPTTSPSPIL